MQLLISVKNIEETLLALDAGVDIIDLKDPNIGALGALDLVMTQQILAVINGRANKGQTMVSATVGERHKTLGSLLYAMQTRADLGVDIIKIAVNDLFAHSSCLVEMQGFLTEMQRLMQRNIKLVVVMFADEKIALDYLPMLQKAGFYGAMLDTQNKAIPLPNALSNKVLQSFVQSCAQYDLKSGLAGGLRPQHVEFLCELQATYLGFRGGVCENFMRKSTLSRAKLDEIKKLLCKHNKTSAKAQETLVLALHSDAVLSIVHQ